MACHVAEEVCSLSPKGDGRASLSRRLLPDIATLVAGCVKSHGRSGLLSMMGESVGAP